MNDEQLKKFVTHMRSTGQADDVIAHSLIDAGNDELSVLNVMGVSDMAELDEPEEETADEAPIINVMSADGQPLISVDNLPKPVNANSSSTTTGADRRYPRPAPRRTASPAPKYGHRSYKEFLARTQSHKEIEAGNEHTLESGADQMLDAAVEPLAPVNPTKEVENKYESKAENIDQLLNEQKEEAKLAPTGPQITDLVDAKDLADLEKIESPTKAPKPVDLKDIPATPDIVNLHRKVIHFRGDSGMKLVVITIGTLALIALAYSITKRIGG